MNEKKLDSGYAYEPGFGAVYSFEHFPLETAKELEEKAGESVYVIETINWTYAAGTNRRMVHRNRYFAVSLAEALGLAAHMQIGFAEVAENIVAIRLATDAETEKAFELMDHFYGQLPAAISDATPKL